MKRTLFVALALAVGLGWAAAAQAQEIPGQYIVLLKAGASPAAVATAHGLAPDRVFGHAVNGFSGHIPPGHLRALQSDPSVEAVVPDHVVKA